jgi:hypothetical protein
MLFVIRVLLIASVIVIFVFLLLSMLRQGRTRDRR